MQTMDMEYKPWGGLAGVYSGIQSSQMDQSNQNKLAMQGLENVIKGVQAGRDVADFSDPEQEMWRQRKLKGEGMQAYTKGMLDYGTMDASLKQKLQELRNKTDAGEMQQTIDGLQKFVMQATSNGPAGLAVAIESLPPEYKQIVNQMERQNPGSSPVLANDLLKTLKEIMADTAENRGKMNVDTNRETVKGNLDIAKQALSDANAMERTKVHEAGANARTAATNKIQKEAQDKITSIDQVIAKALRVLSEETDPIKRKSAEDTIKKGTEIKKIIAAAAAEAKAKADQEWLASAQGKAPQQSTVINLDGQ